MEKARLSTNVGLLLPLAGQSAGTDAHGAPSVITLGKNQVVNQRERILRPARMVGFVCFQIMPKVCSLDRQSKQ